MSDRFLPYGRQWVDEHDIESVIAVLKSDYLTTGPKVEEFERLLSEYTGAGNAIAVNSGTAALHAAYFAAGIKSGDEIITTPLTFAATANAALYLGATVKFVDVQPDTGNIDPKAVEAAISEKTRLIVAVDYTGHPADYDELNDIARKREIPIIADAAHSLGATYKGRRSGTLADLTEMSFHPVKIITTAEGGAVLTNDQTLARRAAMFRNHGIIREPDAMQGYEGPWFYEMQELGFNYRLSDIHSALGISQLRKLDAFLARRRQIADIYNEAFNDLPQLILPSVRDYVEPSWHLYVIRTQDPNLRGPLFARLKELNIGVQVHYIPVYRHPYYQQLGYEKGLCPNAEDYYSRAISIPIYPKMSDDDVESVIERVHRAVSSIS